MGLATNLSKLKIRDPNQLLDEEVSPTHVYYHSQQTLFPSPQKCFISSNPNKPPSKSTAISLIVVGGCLAGIASEVLRHDTHYAFIIGMHLPTAVLAIIIGVGILMVAIGIFLLMRNLFEIQRMNSMSQEISNGDIKLMDMRSSSSKSNSGSNSGKASSLEDEVIKLSEKVTNIQDSNESQGGEYNIEPSRPF